MTSMRQSLLLAAVCGAAAFNGISSLKLPTVGQAMQEHEAAEKFGDKKLVVVTGTSSGLGRKTALALLRTGKYHVIGAVRDLDKMEAVAEIDEFNPELFTPMEVELNSFESVRKFCNDLNEFKLGRPLDRLLCNAAVYQPSLPYAKWSVDGHEQQMQINYLSHFLMISILLPELTRAEDARVILVGSVTGNDNTVGGGGVYPIADLKQLEGLKAGAKNPISMFDGYDFDGAKAYKDSKLCLMMTSNILHDKYHKQTGISFSSIYPGCIAESPLFREKRPWFRKYFPIFMKYITGGFVGEEEAGMRLFQVAHDPRCSKSGVYWSWNGGPREGRGEEALERDGQILGGGGAGGGWDSIYENDQSDKVLNKDTASDLFEFSTIVTDAEWPAANQQKAPDPVLQIVEKVTKMMYAKEEAKRMKPAPGNVVVGSSKSIAAAADATEAVVSSPAHHVAGEATSGAFEAEVVAQPKKYGLWRRIRRFGRGPPKEAPPTKLALAAEKRAIEAAEAAAAKAAEAAIDARLEQALGREGTLPLDEARAHLEECLGDDDECEVPQELQSA